MYVSQAPPRVAREYFIPHGHAGIEWTVLHMRRLGRRAAAQPDVVSTARAIAGDASSDEEAAAKIRRFLADHVVFRYDPEGVELIRTPRYLLRTIAARGHAEGDCDDVAVLGAALGMALGLRARYVLVALSPSEPYEHVFTELVTREAGPVELDTTRPAQMPPGVVIYRTGFREA